MTRNLRSVESIDLARCEAASTSLFRESRHSPDPLPSAMKLPWGEGLHVDVAGGVMVSVIAGVSVAGAGLSALSPLCADASMAGWVGSPSLAWYMGRWR